MTCRRLTLRAIAITGLLVHPIVLRAQHLGLTFAYTTSDILTTYSDGTSSGQQNRNAFSAGVTYRHYLGYRTVLQPELLWVPKGYGPDSKPTRTLGYVEVPVLVRFGALAPKGASFSPVFTVGPTLAVLATCKLAGMPAVTTNESCDQVITTPYEADYRMKRVDVGLMLGLGFEARGRKGGIVGIEGRYEHGFVDSENQPGNSHNQVFFLVLHVVPSKWY